MVHHVLFQRAAVLRDILALLALQQLHQVAVAFVYSQVQFRHSLEAAFFANDGLLRGLQESRGEAGPHVAVRRYFKSGAEVAIVTIIAWGVFPTSEKSAVSGAHEVVVSEVVQEGEVPKGRVGALGAREGLLFQHIGAKLESDSANLQMLTR
mgnify:CR=1 FL=1